MMGERLKLSAPPKKKRLPPFRIVLVSSGGLADEVQRRLP